MDIILQEIESPLNVALIEQNDGEDKEYNINDKHWIPMPN